MTTSDEAPPEGITELFVSWRAGDEAAFNALFTALYGELRVMAHRQAVRGQSGDTLRTTALVHEAYLRLVDGKQLAINDRGHFLALAARVMRNVLVDKARERGRDKRGGDLRRVELDDDLAVGEPAASDVLAVDAALERLAQLDSRQAEVAHMRVFGGMTVEEVAQVLAVSTPTIKRDWRKARIFLMHELRLEPSA